LLTFTLTSQEPEIRIDDAALDVWKRDQLADAEIFLTAAIPLSRNPSYHVLASRALVRARLRQWDVAIADAKEVFSVQFPHTLPLTLIHTKSIGIQPSVMGFIAKSVSLVGKGKKLAAYRACDIAFEHVHSTHFSFLLLMKVCIHTLELGCSSAAHVVQAVIVCMAGDHDDAISRVDDLAATLHLNSICYVVQAREQRARSHGEYHD
jgi:hypothetical protein